MVDVVVVTVVTTVVVAVAVVGTTNTGAGAGVIMVVVVIGVVIGADKRGHRRQRNAIELPRKLFSQRRRREPIRGRMRRMMRMRRIRIGGGSGGFR